MTERFAIYDEGTLGPFLEIRQSGEVVGVTQTALNLNRVAIGNIPVTGDVNYFEQVVWATNPSGSQDVMEAVVGVVITGYSPTTAVGNDAFGIGFDLAAGTIRVNNAVVATVGAAALGDVIGVRLDLEQDAVTFFRNGIQQAAVDVSGAPWAGATWNIATSLGSQANADMQAFLNTGQRSFEYPDPLAPLGWFDVPVEIDTIWLGTHDDITATTDEPANQRIEGCVPISNISFTVKRDLLFWTDGSESVTRPSIASITILDPNGAYDDLISGAVRDLPVVLYEKELDDDLAGAEIIGTYVVDRVEAIDDMHKRLVLKDGVAMLDNPIQRRLFLPSVDSSAANRPIPISLGAPLSVIPIYFGKTMRDVGAGPEEVRQYKIHDEPLLGFGYFRDKGDILDGIDTPTPVYYASLDGQGVDLLVNPAGKLTIDVSSVGGDVPIPPPNLVPSSLAGWDTTSGVTELAGTYTFDDTITSNLGRVESYLKMNAVLAPMVTYKYSLEIEDMSGFFGGTGQETKVQFIRAIGAGNKPELQLKTFSEPGIYTGTFTNTSAGTNDMIVAMVGTQSPVDFAELSVSISITEVSTEPVTSENLVPITLRDFLFEVLIKRGGFSESQVDLAKAQDIDDITGYLGIGWHTADQVTVRHALEDVLPSYGVCLAPNRFGVFVPIRLVDPALETPIGEITDADMLDDLRIYTDGAPGLTNRFGLQRNETVLDPTDFVDDYDPATGVDLPTRTKLGRPYREIETAGGSFARAYPFAYSADALGSRFFRRADAQTEVDRIRTIFVTERKFYEVTVPLDRPYDLGQFYTLTYDRYALGDGKVLMIRGIAEDRINDRATLTLWG